MRRVLNICFPRTGHHVLMRLLTKYVTANPRFEWLYNELEQKHADFAQLEVGVWERHNTRRRALLKQQPYCSGPLVYCERYEHCNCDPCAHPSTNWQKTHDFDLLTVVPRDRILLIQSRNPIKAIVSQYVGYHKSDIINETRKSWEDFARYWLAFWVQWMTKWGGAGQIIWYESLVANTEQVLEDLIKKVELPFSQSLLKSVVAAVDMNNRNRLEDFQFFDKDFLSELERQAVIALPALSIPTLFEQQVVTPPVLSDPSNDKFLKFL